MNKNVEKLYEELVNDQNQDASYTIDRESLLDFFKVTIKLLFLNYYKLNYTKTEVEEMYNLAYLSIKNSFGSKYNEYKEKIDEIFDNLPNIRDSLMLDLKAIYEGDPASQSFQEIILTYPGFLAIESYRIAHEFYIRNLKITARIISEYAHSRTGIDINPGAKIGKSFFIDHGTGIVIGETTVIGDNVKIYQGVTLGALSLKDGRDLQGEKRHPTILNNVTIYSGSSIFGGKTIIGNNVVIGSNCEIKESVKDNSIVTGSFCKIR